MCHNATIQRAMCRTQDLRVKEIVRLLEPRALKEALRITEAAGATVFHNREAVRNILHRKDPRPLVVVGPCSIHDVNDALESLYSTASLKSRTAVPAGAVSFNYVHHESKGTTTNTVCATRRCMAKTTDDHVSVPTSPPTASVNARQHHRLRCKAVIAAISTVSGEMTPALLNACAL